MKNITNNHSSGNFNFYSTLLFIGLFLGLHHTHASSAIVGKSVYYITPTTTHTIYIQGIGSKTYYNTAATYTTTSTLLTNNGLIGYSNIGIAYAGWIYVNFDDLSTNQAQNIPAGALSISPAKNNERNKDLRPILSWSVSP